MGFTTYESDYRRYLNLLLEKGSDDGEDITTKKTSKRIAGVTLRQDLSEGFPILRAFYIPVKSAFKEMVWVWKKSDNTKQLGEDFLDEFADENGCIGKSYGYQLSYPMIFYKDQKNRCYENIVSYPDQVSYMINFLKEFPMNGCAVTTFLNIKDLPVMNFHPYCHTMNWSVNGGKLNLMINQSSGDFLYTCPIISVQYAALLCIMAKIIGVQPGVFTHTIADANVFSDNLPKAQATGAILDLMYACTPEGSAELVRGEEEEDSDPSDTRKPMSYFEERASSLYNPVKAEDAGELGPEVIGSVAAGVVGGNTNFITPEVTDFSQVDPSTLGIDGYSFVGKMDFGDVII